MANRVLRIDVTEVTREEYRGARAQAPRVVMERKTEDGIEGFIFRVKQGEYKLYLLIDGKYYVGDMGSYSPHDFVKFTFNRIQTITTVIFDNPDFAAVMAPSATPKRAGKRSSAA